MFCSVKHFCDKGSVNDKNSGLPSVLNDDSVENICESLL